MLVIAIHRSRRSNHAELIESRALESPLNALRVTLAAAGRTLCRRATSGLCLGLRLGRLNVVKLGLGIAHGLRQHLAHLVFANWFGANVLLWLCHSRKLRAQNQNSKAVGLAFYLHHERAILNWLNRRLSPIWPNSDTEQAFVPDETIPKH